jgi:polyhydroxyalkanoate synthase
VPFLNIYGSYDHVTPPPSVIPPGELVGSDDSETRALQAAHIGLLVGSSARKQTLPTVMGWLEARGLELQH